MNGIFMPMFIQGLAGVSRRLYDGGASYALRAGGLHWNVVHVVLAAWLPGARADPVHHQLLLEHLRTARRSDDNPWEATTLEWATPSPPPHGNFADAAERRTAVRTSTACPGAPSDFLPQNARPEAGSSDGDSLHRRSRAPTPG